MPHQSGTAPLRAGFHVHAYLWSVMVWVLTFEIALALVIGFVVLRSQSASPVGRIDELE